MNADHGRMVLDRGEVPVRWVGRVSICVLIGLVVGPMIGTVLTGPGEGGLVGFHYGLYIGPLVGALLGLAWGVLGQKRAGLLLHSLGRVCTLVLVGLVLAVAVGKYISVHQGVAGFNGLGKWFWLGPGLGALLGVIWSLRSWNKVLSDPMRHTQ